MDAGPAVRRNQVRGLRGQAPRRVLPLAHRTDQLQRKEQPVGKRPRRRSAPSRASRKKIWLEVWRVAYAPESKGEGKDAASFQVIAEPPQETGPIGNLTLGFEHREIGGASSSNKALTA